MGRRYKLGFLIVVIVGIIGLLNVYFSHHAIAVLNPKGVIAQKEFNLMLFAGALMLVIVIPVFVMTAVIAWKYREGNTKPKKYEPDWDGSRFFESIWWGFPILIIVILSVVTWQSSHELDPFKPLTGKNPPMTIQVVALQWKWLFLYPKQNIATVNFVEMPTQTPVTFQITSDAPMNSFWIPSLGGQMYAMTGMSTELNLMANGNGSYRGSSANISGEGFAGMHFVAKSTSTKNFDQWVASVQASGHYLGKTAYTELAEPSLNNRPAAYSLSDANLYNEVIMKYAGPNSNAMAGMNMQGMTN